MATHERKQGDGASTKSSEQSKNQEQRRQEGLPAAQNRGFRGQPGMHEPFLQLRNEFERMFDRFMGGWPSRGVFSGWPAMRDVGQPSDFWSFDVDETDAAVVVRADAPGFEPGDFDLEVRGNQLVLCGQHREESTEKERGAKAWSEREICRVITLPADVNAEKVDAQYRNGVLTVTLPKTTPTSSQRITVKG